MIKPFQKIAQNVKLKNGYYHPKYSIKRLGILEEEFVEAMNESHLKLGNSLDEHVLVNNFQNKAKKKIEIILNKNLINQNFQEDTINLLFYHWYERRYNKNIMDNNILYSLNTSTIATWYDTFSRDELSINIFDKLQKHLRSERFPNFSVYYEYFYDFFPLIEKFTFEEIKQKAFLLYLLELFPKIVAINYKNRKSLWRLTDVELKKMGDDIHEMTTMDRNKTHNAIIYNDYNLPCFYPSYIGEKNYEYYKIGSEIHTPLSRIVKFRMRNIENEFRQDRNLPRIGEGWISETLLYYKIKTAFKDYDIVQHGRPNWLGLQHFDIYFPKINIAIEYQGIQHEKPIEYFGGESAFKKNQERDERKRKLCVENNCMLLYVFPNEKLDEFIIKLEKIIIGLVIN